MRAELVPSLEDVAAADWNALDGADWPFLRHEFLLALETSGCVGPGTGWQPAHLLIRDGRQLVGAMPLYRKTDSTGEFVFDWSWADAYRRAGLRYYPKLVAAVPFTPATGPRLLTDSAGNRQALRRQLLEVALATVRELAASSLHVLFPTADDRDALAAAGLQLRKDCQFHWHNRAFADFDAFLATFTAEKRKKARRERRRVQEAGISFRHYAGGEIDDRLWADLMPLYASTFWRRGREPYLNEAFFREAGRTLPEHLLAIVAVRHGKPVATAICFRGSDTLYGRYWGSSGDYHSLHFETCYYQGIDYCIARGLNRFEPGTQGEHKLARGFVPTETWSAHWLSHPQFSAAIGAYLKREGNYLDEYIAAAQEHVPYRRTPD